MRYRVFACLNYLFQCQNGAIGLRKLRISAAIASVCLSLAVVVCSSCSTAAINRSTASPLWKMQHYGATASPKGYSPAQIKTAYDIGSSSGTGKGKTIAIVVAYGDPNLKSDLAAFDSTFSLSDANLTIHDCGVESSESGWALETALDAEWAHAMAPDASLLVVEAASDDSSDLLSAVDYAVSSGAQIVSMSWGCTESPSQVFADSHFSSGSTVFLAASGDDGSGAVWPASSSNVISVGGTSLSLDSSGARTGETAWSSSGGGISFFESEPQWQSNFGIASVTRATPDVSFNADPKTGVSVYCSVEIDGASGWYQMGGTSLGAPAWAGIVADINESTAYIKNAASFYILAGSSSYKNTGNCFNDITRGNNGFYEASTGYDVVTGLGSPQVGNLETQAVADASALSSSAAATTTTTTRVIRMRPPIQRRGY
jgi:subtilase family serine protease